MENIVTLREIFSEYEFGEALGNAVVDQLTIDREERLVSVSIRAAQYGPAAEMEGAAQAIGRSYLLGRLVITPHFPPETLEQLDFSELSDLLIREYSPAAGSLAGCKWSLEGDTLRLNLRANGKEPLEKQMPKLRNYLAERFGRKVETVIEAGNALEGQALFNELARIRQEALTHVPEPVFKDKATAASAPSASKLQEDTILGKPFKGNIKYLYRQCF